MILTFNLSTPTDLLTPFTDNGWLKGKKKNKDLILFPQRGANHPCNKVIISIQISATQDF